MNTHQICRNALHGAHIACMAAYYVVGFAAAVFVIQLFFDEYNILNGFHGPDMLRLPLEIGWEVFCIVAGIALAVVLIMMEFECDRYVCNRYREK